MKRVIVTGGAGFLGSHLCERLLQDGHDVLSVDNYFTGTKSNITHLLGNPYFEALRHDVTFPLYVEADEIYNLACPASPIYFITNLTLCRQQKPVSMALSICLAWPKDSKQKYFKPPPVKYTETFRHIHSLKVTGAM